MNPDVWSHTNTGSDIYLLIYESDTYVFGPGWIKYRWRICEGHSLCKKQNQIDKKNNKMNRIRNIQYEHPF